MIVSGSRTPTTRYDDTDTPRPTPWRARERALDRERIRRSAGAAARYHARRNMHLRLSKAEHFGPHAASDNRGVRVPVAASDTAGSRPCVTCYLQVIVTHCSSPGCILGGCE